MGALVVLTLAANVTPAGAAPGAPSVHIQDGEDGFVNAAEATAVQVVGKTDLAATKVSVQIVNSATCDNNAGIEKTPVVFVTPVGGDYAATFNLTSFSEGAVLCARARASTDGTTFGDLGISDNDPKPIKDTVILPGRAEIVDPNADGFLNLSESDAEIPVRWIAFSDDSKFAQTWFQQAGGAIPAACGREPAVMADGVASGARVLTIACADALAEDAKFSFNAQWQDAAGNLSIAAASLELVKDTIAPAAPTVNIELEKINIATVKGVRVSGASEAGARVEVTLVDALGATVLGAATAADNGAYALTVDATQLADGIIAATGVATDRAANVSVVSEADTAAKDTVAPAAPTISWSPNEISKPEQAFVELTVDGETGTMANLSVDDEDPGTAAITRQFLLSSAATVYVDVTPLTDGVLKASATLTDSFNNTGAAGTASAIKKLTDPSVRITSPAQGSLNTGNVRIEGTAPAGAPVTVLESSGKVVGTTNADSNGAWSVRTTYTTSGTRTIYARTPANPVGSGRVTFDVDAVKPKAEVLTPNLTVFQGGQQVVIEGRSTDDFSGPLAIEVTIFDARGAEVDPGANTVDPTKSSPRVVVGKAIVQNNAVCDERTDLQREGKFVCPVGKRTVNWKLTLPSLPNGYYSAEAVAVDRAGNESLQPGRVSFVKL